METVGEGRAEEKTFEQVGRKSCLCCLCCCVFWKAPVEQWQLGSLLWKDGQAEPRLFLADQTLSVDLVETSQIEQMCCG